MDEKKKEGTESLGEEKSLGNEPASDATTDTAKESAKEAATNVEEKAEKAADAAGDAKEAATEAKDAVKDKAAAAAQKNVSDKAEEAPKKPAAATASGVPADLKSKYSKIEWPTAGRVWSETLTVIIVTAIMATIIFFVDLGLREAIEGLMSI